MNEMEPLDFVWQLFHLLGIVKSMNQKTLFDTCSSIFSRYFLRMLTFTFPIGLAIQIFFNQLTAEEFVEALLYLVAMTSNCFKGLVISCNQQRLIDLKKFVESNSSTVQKKEEETIHKRYNNFIRYYKKIIYLQPFEFFN